MSKLAKRCDLLEDDSEVWMKERDGLTAKFKTDLDFERVKYSTELELATTSLNNQIEELMI
jgi:hypothetical protein